MIKRHQKKTGSNSRGFERCVLIINCSNVGSKEMGPGGHGQMFPAPEMLESTMKEKNHKIPREITQSLRYWYSNMRTQV